MLQSHQQLCCKVTNSCVAKFPTVVLQSHQQSCCKVTNSYVAKSPTVMLKSRQQLCCKVTCSYDAISLKTLKSILLLPTKPLSHFVYTAGLLISSQSHLQTKSTAKCEQFLVYCLMPRAILFHSDEDIARSGECLQNLSLVAYDL